MKVSVGTESATDAEIRAADKEIAVLRPLQNFTAKGSETSQEH